MEFCESVTKVEYYVQGFKFFVRLPWEMSCLLTFWHKTPNTAIIRRYAEYIHSNFKTKRLHYCEHNHLIHFGNNQITEVSFLWKYQYFCSFYFNEPSFSQMLRFGKSYVFFWHNERDRDRHTNFEIELKSFWIRRQLYFDIALTFQHSEYYLTTSNFGLIPYSFNFLSHGNLNIISFFIIIFVLTALL